MREKIEDDTANGYESFASDYMARRDQSRIGVATVRKWAGSLEPGTAILDLGCGHGVPVSRALLDDGFTIYGVDASPSLAEAFGKRCPEGQVVCEPVEKSSFFDRKFDAALASGLMFLLPAQAQRDLIAKVALALNPGGRFLFSAPTEKGAWRDVLTGRESLSLGIEAYLTAISDAGLSLLAQHVDEGENHYYDTAKACLGRLTLSG
ncbi:MAG TPA: class I SAM-dependent methyltransferase [Acidobacteriota bacterium]|nr:class I SAM-dependent methyltransferase [Acidobacteriota bacterium]